MTSIPIVFLSVYIEFGILMLVTHAHYFKYGVLSVTIKMHNHAFNFGILRPSACVFLALMYAG